ncbi:MAG: acyl--CoA ligase, partial [Alphaproteobacteria bacterium]|nr:acyl--CoA ligase [Alphaproteobacteria bacterium]
NPSRIANAGVTHGARVLYAAPSQLLLYATQAQAEPALTWPDLRWVISSGARWPKDQKQQLRKLFPKARFGEFYGSSETSFVSYSIDGDETPEASSGKLFPGVDLRILDASGAEPDAKQSGRIAVRSAMTFDGYALDKNDATLKDDWVLTGDSGWRDENRYLFLDGRSNRMIVTSGKNLFPEEVETFLQRHPAIEQSAVLALADSRRGERLAACLKIRAGASCSRRELIAYLRLHLPLYKIPRLYFSVVDWPFTTSQKTAFAQLQMQLQAGQYGALP